MKISSSPDNYTGTYTPLVYKIEGADPAVVTEVTAVMPGTKDSPIGVKRFSGSGSFTVNVANYYRKYLDPRPVFTKESTFVNAPARTTVAAIIANGTGSVKSMVTAGAENGRECALLSHSPGHTAISTDEHDELSFFAPGRTLTVNMAIKGKAGIIDLHTSKMTCGEGIYTYVVNMRDIAAMAGGLEGYSLLTVEVSESGKTVMNRSYDIVPHDPGAVRVCWLNPFGAIDYHTFSPVQAETVATAKSKVYGADGYAVSSSEAETYISVTSQCEPAETMRWLAGILSSPKVWIADTQKLHDPDTASYQSCFTPVDVVTNNAAVYGEKPAALRITLRGKKKKTYQNG